MAKIDKVKEKANFYRNLFFIGLTALLGMVAYLFANAENMAIGKIFLNIFGIFVDICVLFAVIVRYRKKTNQLEEL